MTNFFQLLHIQAYDKKRRRAQNSNNNLLKKSRWPNHDFYWEQMKHSSLKENEHGHDHFSNVLGITLLQDLIELRISLKMPIWDYDDKFYLKTNGIKIIELLGAIGFKNDNPYIADLTFSKYDFGKKGEQITGYNISGINKNLLNTNM